MEGDLQTYTKFNTQLHTYVIFLFWEKFYSAVKPTFINDCQLSD